MLNLETGVHLQKVKFTVGCHDAFDSACIHILGCAGKLDGRIANTIAQTGWQSWRGRLFNQLLKAPLD